MPNRKEPRLEIDEPPLIASLGSDAANQSEALLQGEASSVQPNSIPNPKPSKSQESLSTSSPKGSPKASSGKAWLGILLALTALGLLAWQFLLLEQATQQGVQQQQSMQVLANRIQELETILLTTGNDLSAAGKQFNEKLDWADSEIRKLWVIAHQRNRPAIDSLENKVKQLEQGLTQSEKQLAEVLAISQTAALASKAATEQNLALAKDLNNYKTDLNTSLNANTDKIRTSIEEISNEYKGLTQRLTEVSLMASTLDERLRSQDLRTNLAALEKRVTELSSKMLTTQDLPNESQAKLINELTAQVAEQQSILTSLEASRGQLVSRVTRLMEEVRLLQQVN